MNTMPNGVPVLLEISFKDMGIACEITAEHVGADNKKLKNVMLNLIGRLINEEIVPYKKSKGLLFSGKEFGLFQLGIREDGKACISNNIPESIMKSNGETILKTFKEIAFALKSYSDGDEVWNS